MTIVTWKWNSSEYRVDFPASAVNTLKAMIDRNTTDNHRFICITDDSEGVECETYPLWDDLRSVKNVHWQGGGNPVCYVRLKAFSEWFREIAGDRFLSIDLDTVILGNIDYIFDRKEDFIINKGGSEKNDYNGAMWMMDTGSRSHVYDRFTPEYAKQASGMYMGSDQAWIRWILGKNEATFSEGIYNYQMIKRKLPEDAKIVFFHGFAKPWNIRNKQKWIETHYRQNSDIS